MREHPSILGEHALASLLLQPDHLLIARRVPDCSGAPPVMPAIEIDGIEPAEASILEPAEFGKVKQPESRRIERPMQRMKIRQVGFH